VTKAAAGVDAILVAASPRIMQSVTVEDRARSYRDVLVASCESAAAACDRVLFLSSISVYGDGTQATGDVIDEETPRTTSDEPSSVYFGMAEDAALAAPRGSVLRLADVHGHPRDIDYTARLRMVHEHMGGSTAFAGDGRLHRVNVEDVARAVLHVFDNDLTGVFNCVPDLVPPLTNREAFDMLADRAGLPHIEFRDELRTPTQQVVSAKLRATGFVFEHPDDELQ
jgi:nucleoside-diphosphate-sugar epimerase